MKSIELNRAYYTDCVSRILDSYYPELSKRHAAALIGWGSEILGNDDEYSKRYGWGPRIIIFLENHDYIEHSHSLLNKLEKHIPSSFMGCPTRFTNHPVCEENGYEIFLDSAKLSHRQSK